LAGKNIDSDTFSWSAESFYNGCLDCRLIKVQIKG